MGNSYCCNSIEKLEQITNESEIMVNIENTIKLNDNFYLKDKNENKINKIPTSFSPENNKDLGVFNPLPDIVIIRRNKH